MIVIGHDVPFNCVMPTMPDRSYVPPLSSGVGARAASVITAGNACEIAAMPRPVTASHCFALSRVVKSPLFMSLLRGLILVVGFGHALEAVRLDQRRSDLFGHGHRLVARHVERLLAVHDLAADVV